nr:ORF7 [Agarophyton chilense]
MIYIFLLLDNLLLDQQNIIDFDFQLIFSSCSSKRFIQSIKVRRSKVVLIN